MAIFTYGDKSKSQNIITEIERNGKKLLVGIHFTKNKENIEINDIRSVFPKDNSEWLNWVNQNDKNGNKKLLYVDKKRVLALIDQQRTNLAEVEYLDLNSVTNIIKTFENPISDEAVANGTFMKAPNGNPTNLNEQQWIDVRTSRFKDWFGDWENDTENSSKVIDGNGEPMVVYHNTNVNSIETFFYRFNPYILYIFVDDFICFSSYNTNIIYTFRL